MDLQYLRLRYPVIFIVAPKDWHARLDGSFTRGLVGGEILMEWMHEQLNGGVSQLSIIYIVHWFAFGVCRPAEAAAALI